MKKLLIFVLAVVSLLAWEKEFNQARQMLFQGRFQEAKDLLDKVIEQAPSRPEAYYNRGLASLMLDEFDKAEKDFSSAIGLGDESADVYNNRGLARSYIGEIESSLGDFNLAISIDSNFAEAYINRASNHIVLNNLFNAEDDLKKAKELDPNNPEIYLQLGRLMHTMNQFGDAVKNFSKAIELGLDNYKLYYNRANSYYKMQEWGLAAQDYSKTLELNKDDALALNNRAMAFDRMGLDSLAEIDRAKLREMSAKTFQDYEDLKVISYSDSDSLFSMILPVDWFTIERKNDETDRTDMLISKDELKSDNDQLVVGVTIGLIQQMSDKFPVKNPSEILQSWITGIDQSAEEYYQYEIKMKKSYPLEGFPAQLNMVRVQMGPSYMAFNIYQLAVAYGDNLFYAYFQAPSHEFSYYEPIFDEAIKSLALNVKAYYKGEEQFYEENRKDD